MAMSVLNEPPSHPMPHRLARVLILVVSVLLLVGLVVAAEFGARWYLSDRAEREETIAAFLARHGYEDVIVPVPAPPSSTRVRFDAVEGFGMPAPGADAIESVQAEVDHVVDVVIDHALSRPDRSLAVITLNARHADRVREAVIAAVADSPAVAQFFAADKDEPFVVLDADGAAGLRRDTIVLSLGYAKTPHGRVLHNFGIISGASSQCAPR